MRKNQQVIYLCGYRELGGLVKRGKLRGDLQEEAQVRELGVEWG